ncbi:hypothetical protein [Hymenobacter norwichensis]|uniref:hypothetical protein n=1 Tax=Hymenobacter norwichensis TaxID=223903 RepID=UPI0003B7A5ED|nr:hypothetical protein [Hymenobacter norwichensis]
MKSHLLITAALMSLGACTNGEKENDAVPATITTGFNQEFRLNYRQQANISSGLQTELTVKATDFRYAFCPRNANCFTADFVWPTLSIQDAQGQAQEMKLTSNPRVVSGATLLDTTSIRANGQRYVLQYIIWDVAPNTDSPQKKDISVALRIIKPTTNGQ